MSAKLRIAILAPLKRPITPDTTVSRNRVIVDLVSGLIAKGHEVTLFATGDSHLPGVKVVEIIPQGLNFLPAAENPFYQHTSFLTQMIKRVVDAQGDFDIIHNHMYPEYLALLALDSFKIPLVTTVHSQMVVETVGTLKQFPHAHLIAISEMAKKAAGMPNLKVVHNSVDTNLFTPNENLPHDYLLSVGRMSKAKDEGGKFLDPKGVQNAIQVAEMSGERLKIVGNVEDPEFFETLVKPHLSDKIEFMGELSPEQTLSRQQIADLFKGAKAFLNPINWQEPFGLVMAEALASGTPVVAYDRGAVSEIVRDGVTGFIVKPEISDLSHLSNLKIQKSGIEGLCEAVKRISEIDRTACRDHAVTHFSTQRMVDEYEKVYFEAVGK